MRAAGQPTVFSRKVGIRAIGENITPVAENYLARQTHRSAFADERYRSTLAAESFEDTTLDLAEPAEVKRGRYWYNLHLVLVTAGRFRMGKEDFALKLRASAQSAAVEHGCALKAFAPMPDHIISRCEERSNWRRWTSVWRFRIAWAAPRDAGCRMTAST